MNTPWTVPEATRPSWLTNEIQAVLESKKYPVNKDGMLMLWQQTKIDLASIKEAEMDYRKICADFLVTDHQKNEGTNTVELGNNYQAKIGIKFNYKLDSDNDKIWKSLDKIASIGNEGSFIAQRLISWTPNFLLTEYRTLQEEKDKGSQVAADILKEIESILTITEAAPTLEIKEAKKKK